MDIVEIEEGAHVQEQQVMEENEDLQENGLPDPDQPVEPYYQEREDHQDVHRPRMPRGSRSRDREYRAVAYHPGRNYYKIIP